MHVSKHGVRRSEDNLQETIVYFVGLGTQTQVIRLGVRCLYLLSLFTGSVSLILEHFYAW